MIESSSSLFYSVMATKRRVIRCRRWALNGICARKVRIELLHPRIQSRDRGPGPTHTLEKHKDLGFLSDSGLIPWKITKLHRGTGRVTLSVRCLATDASLTVDTGVEGSIPARSHTFVEIDHEIISTVILLLTADLFKKGCCQLHVLQHVLNEVLVNCLFKLAQEKVWLGKLTGKMAHRIFPLFA